VQSGGKEVGNYGCGFDGFFFLHGWMLRRRKFLYAAAITTSAGGRGMVFRREFFGKCQRVQRQFRKTLADCRIVGNVSVRSGEFCG